MKGRPIDPKRAKRGTGHRPPPGQTKRKLPVAVEQPAPPAPPDDLVDEHAREVWTRAIAELWDRGLREADLEAVRLMSIQAARAHRAEALIAESGMVVRGPRGPVANPLIRIERDAARTYLTFAESFGLSYMSRMRVGLMQLAGRSLADQIVDSLEHDE